MKYQDVLYVKAYVQLKRLKAKMLLYRPYCFEHGAYSEIINKKGKERYWHVFYYTIY